jgi:predicted Zn-dependent protease with MMP-like domain
MTRAAFEALVREAMRAIPRQFRDRMKNVEIVVEGLSLAGTARRDGPRAW